MPPTDKMSPTDKTLSTDKGPPTVIKPSIPKSRIGQGKAVIRRKARVIMPTPMPIQAPTLPILTPAPRAVQSVSKPMV